VKKNLDYLYILFYDKKENFIVGSEHPIQRSAGDIDFAIAHNNLEGTNRSIIDYFEYKGDIANGVMEARKQLFYYLVNDLRNGKRVFATTGWRTNLECDDVFSNVKCIPRESRLHI